MQVIATGVVFRPQPPPLLLGARGPKTLRLAGELATWSDGRFATWVTRVLRAWCSRAATRRPTPLRCCARSAAFADRYFVATATAGICVAGNGVARTRLRIPSIHCLPRVPRGRPDRPATPTQRQAVNAAVPLLVLCLDRSRLVGRSTDRLRTSVVRLLLAGQLDLVEPISAELWNGLPEPPVTVIECRGTRFAVGAAADRVLADRPVAARKVLHARLDAGLVCVAAGADVGVVLRSLRPVGGLRVGISEPGPIDDLDGARRQAVRAVEAGDGGGAGAAGPSGSSAIPSTHRACGPSCGWPRRSPGSAAVPADRTPRPLRRISTAIQSS